MVLRIINSYQLATVVLSIPKGHRFRKIIENGGRTIVPGVPVGTVPIISS